MLKLVIVGTVFAVAQAIQHPINREIVSQIRERTHRWVAHDVETNPLRNRTYFDLKGLLGTINRPAQAFEPLDIKYSDPFHVAEGVPTDFDWRSQSNCVHPIRDQQHCGSCWAFAATEALSDRFCIASEGAIDVVLSP